MKAKKFGFDFPKVDYSAQVKEWLTAHPGETEMSETAKHAMYHTPVPHNFPISSKELTELLEKVQDGKVNPGQVFFWKLITGIPGMTMPSPRTGHVHEKYSLMYDVFKTFVHKKVSLESAAEQIFALMQ